ncbi:membrane protein [Moraxella bovoculi]|uniref:Membrane protein n=1 Tax=Moraxella bovoculi TaxID=386891 RepID=A0AAC8PXR6_9GAMM|nr:iron export ABC transporter permease subunit FetB [Moraxella bovoculi]AKG07529.1 membrane protein [Moraxella bovoculi]AKG09866.1 membrane protein [Moraxella bovoculi]AKG11787.1 membrane protein [Moraxella bovoculi]
MAITLSLTDIAFASTLLLITVGVSAYLKLGLVKTLIMAGVRTVVQLSLIGLILAWVFARENLWQVLTILTIMTLIASVSVRQRIKKPYQGLLSDSIISLGVATGLITIIAMTMIIKVSPWYLPQYIIPILGLILGNSLTAISLTTNGLINDLHDKQSLIKSHLSLSAMPFEAVHELVKSAVLSGLTPTINSMLVVGLVSLPGMMTGQVLAGADPTQAVRYQIITMFLICAGSTLSCTVSALLIIRRFFDGRGRFVLPPSA